MRRGVDERITATLRACQVPADAVVPFPPHPGVIGPEPGPPGVERLRAGMRIDRLPPGTDLFGAAAELWRRGGCQVTETHTATGPALTGVDPQGYLLHLTAGPPAVLVVASPPLPHRNRGLGPGIAAGVILGPLGTCLSFTGNLDTSGGGSPLAVWLWLPFLLLIGGLLLIRPATRRFGAGLLIGGAVTGIVLSGICSSMMIA
ncbi:hypothetical protein BXY51_007003 [Actinoplanes cyaneus]|nr:hypothetical protein [Actinoplanes cyaneus]